MEISPAFAAFILAATHPVPTAYSTIQKAEQLPSPDRIPWIRRRSLEQWRTEPAREPSSIFIAPKTAPVCSMA